VKRLLVMMAVSGMLWSATASADVVFTLGNNPQPGEENVLLTAGATGASIFGLTNSSATSVKFSSTTDTLIVPIATPGQITAIDDILSNLSVSVPGGSFQDLIIDPRSSGGTLDITVLANELGGGTATSTFSYTLTGGTNFLTITAINGETLSKVSLDASGGFLNLQAPRISGVATATVPEPTSLILVSLGAAGIAALARRRAKSRSAS
jgi:hypothetical protein